MFQAHRNVNAACPSGSAVTDCYIRNLDSSTEQKITDNFVYDPDRRRYSIRCDTEGDFDHAKWHFDGETSDDWRAPFWMKNNDDNDLTRVWEVDYLKTCGQKTFTVEVSVWGVHAPCAKKTVSLLADCSGSGSGTSGSGTSGSGTSSGSGSGGVVAFNCPVNSVPKIGVASPRTFVDCECTTGFAAQNGACSFSCPANSFAAPNVFPLTSMADCSCSDGFKKDGDDCVVDFECPANSYGKVASPKTFNDCQCVDNFAPQNGVCSFQCPSKSVAKVNVFPLTSFADCSCANGFVKRGDGCVPDYECPANSFPQVGSPQTFNDCRCMPGFAAKNEACTFVCAANSVASVFPANSFADCKCVNGYVKSGTSCAPSFQCPASSVSKPNIPTLSFVDCNCITGFVKAGSSCVPEYKCPANSNPRAGVSSPRTFNDCQCTQGFMGQNGACTFQCAANSVASVFPANSFVDCKCVNGYVKSGPTCVPSFQCPANSVPRVSSPRSFSDCTCSGGFMKSGSSCVPAYKCPANSVPRVSSPQSFSDCNCSGGFMKSGSSCVPEYKCPKYSLPLPGVSSPLSFSDCKCGGGYMESGSRCVFNCLTNSANSFPLVPFPTSAYDCGCNEGFVWRGSVCLCPQGYEVSGSSCVPHRPQNVRRDGHVLFYEPTLPLGFTIVVTRADDNDTRRIPVQSTPNRVNIGHEYQGGEIERWFHSFRFRAFYIQYVDPRGASSRKVYVSINTPIALDLDGSGAIERIAGRFDLDITGDGHIEHLNEWFGPKDGILIDSSSPIKSGNVTGLQLFGNSQGYADGFAKLHTLDDNSNGYIEGDELEGLAVWTDSNSNAKLDDGEVSTLASHGIVSLSTMFHDSYQSYATLDDGSTMYMEDVWFSTTEA